MSRVVALPKTNIDWRTGRLKDDSEPMYRFSKAYKANDMHVKHIENTYTQTCKAHCTTYKRRHTHIAKHI